MKKHIFSMVVIAAVLLTAGFIFTACDTDTGGGGGPTDILDGTVWEQLTGNVPSGGVRLSFNSPNFEYKGITNGTVYAAGPYTVTGNSVSGIITDGESAPGTFTGAISGNTLQITAIVNDGSVSSKTMTKKGSTGNGGGGGSTDILDGTVWEQLTGDVPPGGSRLSFNSPNFEFTVITNGTVYAAGPYTVTGNSVSGTVTDGEAAPGTFTGAISGNTLQYTAIWYNGETSSGTMTRKGSTGGGGGDLSGEPGDGGNTGGGGGGEPGTDGGGALAEAKGKLTLTGFTQFNGNYVYSTLTTASGKTLGGINGVNSDGGFIYMVPISGGTAEVPLYYRESRMVPYEDSDTIQAVSIYLVNEAFGKFFSGDLKSMYENYVALIRNNTSNTSFTPSTTNGSITINRSDIMTLHEINVSEDEDRYTVMQTAKYILWVNP